MYNLLNRFFKHNPLPKEQLDYIVDEVAKRLNVNNQTIVRDITSSDADYIGARLSAIAKDFKPVNILQEDLVDISLPIKDTVDQVSTLASNAAGSSSGGWD